MATAEKKSPNENIEYNTQREHLTIPEYGRSVQKMVEFTITIADREQRSKAAQTIVNVMLALNPHLRELADYKHKLWDHLHIISDFKLDVDSPYPAPSKESTQTKPQRIKYPTGAIRYKYYGRTMESMLAKVAEMEEGQGKEQITQNLANFMKMSYLTWNKDTVDDSTIINHLDELSKGNLKLHESARLNHTAEILAMNKDKNRDRDASKGKKMMPRKKRKK